MLIKATFKCELELTADDEINSRHLAEEIQCYLDSYTSGANVVSFSTTFEEQL